MDLDALALSFSLASVSTAVLLVCGLALASWLAGTPRTPARVVVEALVTLPLVLPPSVLGYYLLVGMGPSGPLGQAWIHLTGRPLAFSFAGLVVASVLSGLPFSVRPFVAALARVDPRLLAAAATLGASRWRTFLEVRLPLAAPGIVAGVVLTFAHALGEFGVVLMVGGNIAGETRTLSISIFSAVEQLDYHAAGVASAFLLVVSFVVLVVTSALQPRGTV